MKRYLLATLALLISAFLQAQDTTLNDVNDASGLRAEGKIYVVVAVLLTILAGVIFYLVRLDRKITKLEKQDV